jgi:phosphoglycolate phosphatase
VDPLTGKDLAPTAVVFDLDGTLIDSRGDIAAAVNHALLATGRKALPANVIAGYVGDGARSLLARASKLSEADPALDDLLERFSTYYLAHPVDFTKWADGAPDVLDRVAAIPLPICLCTNKARPVTEAILAALGVRTRFRAIYAGGDGPEKKPAPGPLLSLAKKLGVDAASLVMVGDGPQDVDCARAAGCRVIGVSSAYSPRDKLLAAKADIVLDGLAGVADVVRRWCDSTARLSLLRR